MKVLLVKFLFLQTKRLLFSEYNYLNPLHRESSAVVLAVTAGLLASMSWKLTPSSRRHRTAPTNDHRTMGRRPVHFVQMIINFTLAQGHITKQYVNNYIYK